MKSKVKCFSLIMINWMIVLAQGSNWKWEECDVKKSGCLLYYHPMSKIESIEKAKSSFCNNDWFKRDSSKSILFYSVNRLTGSLVKYLSLELDKELEKGSEYEFEMNIKFDYKISDYGFKFLGFRFMKSDELLNLFREMSNLRTAHKWLEGDGYVELDVLDTTWQQKKIYYTAKGGERWLLIGLMKMKEDNIFQFYENEITNLIRKDKSFMDFLLKLEIYVESKYMKDNMLQEDFESNFIYRPIVSYKIGCISLKKVKR